ncbi:MAG: methylthioribulose 1-phosphate dehydratase, partial [Alicyclobacillaceae bacterium]|nr:methylthioribulose 1-phosphate dehydratase [Alicyclobacillaceae bacterium]
MSGIPQIHPDVRASIGKELVRLCDQFGRRGWLPATSGNLSMLVERDPLAFGITASGRDKQALTPDDIVFVDGDGRALPGQPGLKPSAETKVHARLYARTGAGCIVHVHTVFNNLASRIGFAAGGVELADLELIKGLDIWEEGARIRVPVVENYADLDRLAEAVADAVADPRVPGVLVREHGIYAWGRTPDEAKRHLEAFEFLFEYTFY